MMSAGNNNYFSMRKLWSQRLYDASMVCRIFWRTYGNTAHLPFVLSGPQPCTLHANISLHRLYWTRRVHFLRNSLAHTIYAVTKLYSFPSCIMHSLSKYYIHLESAKFNEHENNGITLTECFILFQYQFFLRSLVS